MTALSDLAPRWPEVNALLDEALAMQPADRAAWLDALKLEPAALKDTLRDLLAEQARVETNDFLNTWPRLQGVQDTPSGSDEAAAGDTVGPYRLLRVLGEGGMGSVWLAERADGQLKRQVALKLPRLAWGGALAERLARERDILASLTHPHIARLYDAGVDAIGRPWLAMEYIDGQAIDVFCHEQNLPLRRRIELLLQMCDAVAHAHARLVVHRDLKPSNVLVSADGQVHLLDFGIAKLIEGDRTHETALTQLSGRALTVDYASPEQIRGEPLGTTSDVYSLAVVAYELLAGARPYRLKRGSAAELEEAIASADVPLASDMARDAASKKLLRGDLDAILNKALKKDGGQRYATVEAFAQELQRHLNGEPVHARPDSHLYRLRKFAVRNHVAVSAAAALAVVILAGAGAALWQAERATQQARLAQQQAELAKKESRRAEAVQEFLLDIFRASSDQQDDPVKARNATARELLDRGAARLDTALRDAPEARAQVMATLGEMYYQLQLDEQSVAIEIKRIDLLRELHGPRDRRVAQALVDLAASLYTTSQRDRMVPTLEEARGILDALDDTRSRLRGELLTRLAQAHLTISFAKTRDYADAALQVLRPLAVPTEDRGLSTALNWAAAARVQLDELPEAESLYREAIAELGKTRPPSHLALLQTRIALAQTLAAQQKIDDALRTYRMAIDEGQVALGADDGTLAVSRARFAGFVHVTGQRGLARSMYEQALQDVLRIKGEADTLYTTVVRSEYARSMLADGNPKLALRLIEAVTASDRVHYAGTAVLGNSLRLQASILTALGRQAQARAMFAEALMLWRKAGGEAMPPSRTNRFHLDEARLDLAADDPAAALARLQQVALPPYAERMPLVPEAVERDVLLSQAHLAQQAIVPALLAGTRATNALTASPVRHHHAALEAEATLQLGRALLRAGRADAGCAAIARALAWRESNDTPQSPAVVDARRARTQCRAVAIGAAGR